MTTYPFIVPRPEWQRAERAIIIGSGPSLTDQQLVLCAHAQHPGRTKIIAVNNTCERAPFADVAYWGDYTAVKHYIAKLGHCCVEWWSGSRTASERYPKRVKWARSAHREGLGDGMIHLNGNSGVQALNLAACWGAKRIVLVGFDMKRGEDGRDHWFGQHPRPLVQTQLYPQWLEWFVPVYRDALARGIEIINCTPGSALTITPARTLEEELA